MSHIIDKGYKSKRFRLLCALIFIVTLDYKLGSGQTVTAIQWLDFLKWAFAIWVASEVGKAGTEAYRDKGSTNA